MQSFPRTIVPLLAVAVVAGCGGGSGGDSRDVGVPAAIALSGDTVISSDALGEVRYLALVGDRLWLADRSGDPYLHVVDLTGDSLLASLGQRGEGPGDFGETPHLSRRPGDELAVWAYDAVHKRLTRLTGNPQGQLDVRRVAGDQSNHVWSLVWQSPERLVGIGDMDTNRVIITDSSLAIAELVTVPFVAPDSVNLEARRSLSSAYEICVQPTGGRFGLAYQAAGRVELYEPSGRLAGLARVPLPSDGEWLANRRGEVWFNHDRYHYIGCSATDSFFYALYIGAVNDKPTFQARQVHQFNWDGDLVGVFELNNDARVIAVTPDDRLMYTVALGEGEVLRYRLPSNR